MRGCYLSSPLLWSSGWAPAVPRPSALSSWSVFLFYRYLFVSCSLTAQTNARRTSDVITSRWSEPLCKFREGKTDNAALLKAQFSLSTLYGIYVMGAGKVYWHEAWGMKVFPLYSITFSYYGIDSPAPTWKAARWGYVPFERLDKKTNLPKDWSETFQRSITDSQKFKYS